ncbi:MAG: MFS transporter [Acutalibacteraceae bacterium]
MITILAVIYVVFISLGLPDSLFGAAWPVVHIDFGVEESFASLYSIITGLCTGGASFLSGKVIRKFGTPTVTFVSTLLTSAGLLGISFSPNIWVMMFFTIVLGYGAGAIDTALNNYVSLHYETRHMNWLHCFWGVGVTISPIILSFFLNDGSSWRNGYRLIALLQFLIAMIVAIFINKWKKLDTAAEEADAGSKTPNKSFFEILKTKGLKTSILSLGLYCGMEFLLGTWGATFLVNAFGESPDKAARWISLYYGGIMLGRLISGFVSLKVDDNNMIRGGIVISFLGMIILALPFGSTSILGLLLIGIGFGPVFPSVLHSVPSRFGKDYSADITGYHMAGAYAVGFLAQLSFGYIASWTTFKITPFVLLGFVLLLFAANERAIKKTKTVD